MKLEIVSSGEATEVVLEPGVITLGGAGEDGIVVPGLVPAAVELRVDAHRLMVRGKEVFTVDDVLSPPGISRLVLPGERIDLSESVSLRVLPEKDLPQTVGTAAVFKELLGGVGEPEDANSAHLVCLTGLDVGRRFPLCGRTIEVGRGDDVQIRVRDRAVSRKHARLLKVDDGYTIQDLRTPNGLFVNGRLTTRATLLPDGAIVELGQSLLRYRAGVEPPAPPPPEPEPEPEPEQKPEPQPEVAPAPPPGAAPSPLLPRRARPWELALIGVGVTLAIVGVLVSFSLLGAS